jgi:hypothetical protein
MVECPKPLTAYVKMRGSRLLRPLGTDAAQQAHAMGRKEQQPTVAANEKSPVLQALANFSDGLQNGGMAVAGIKPAAFSGGKSEAASRRNPCCYKHLCHNHATNVFRWISSENRPNTFMACSFSRSDVRPYSCGTAIVKLQKPTTA